MEEISTTVKEERAMLSNCANPDCGAAFDYGHGRFFRFRQSLPDSASARNSHAVQHYWLCDACSKTYTLDYRAAIGVLLSPRLGVPSESYIPLLIAEA